ncbi:serine/threonine protein phosphatase [Paenibacillus nanensis]|uniref:Serine/threonine protein phosphatase n=1 Tax=Paenibacillus nanensis TaxID=393251 RepID=A0A3A1V511_9BACL|nr:metallophosphoesterase family protein [Paenibacillus nanensis]RIX53703.1 serine/threonine protein phosphatase [Paenibacillus nanensis]
MRRVIMISDIHGCIEPFNRLLAKVQYTPGQDQLILLGDYVDKGPASQEVVERVMQLVHQDEAVALRGNHDQRLVDFVRGNDAQVRSKFAQHGGLPALQSYCGMTETILTEEMMDEAKSIIEERYSNHLNFLAQLPLYYEDEQHICVHAGLNPSVPNWREQSDHDFMYIKDAFYKNPTTADKRVIFGHTKTIDIHGSADVWFAEDKIGIDGGCSYGMQLNALIYHNGTYRTEAVPANGPGGGEVPS